MKWIILLVIVVAVIYVYRKRALIMLKIRSILPKKK